MPHPTTRRAPTVKAAVPKPNRQSGHPTTRTAAKPKVKGSGGVNIPKFASEVSRNYARGAAKVGQALNQHIASRKKSENVSGAMRNAPKARKALRKALGK